MARDANPNGDVFGGWTLSQMDLAGATFAARRARGRVATVSIEAMEFLRPVAVGDLVSCYCAPVREGESSVTVRIETWARPRDAEARTTRRARRSPRASSPSSPSARTASRGGCPGGDLPGPSRA
jgi:acyl-CoA thioesterase YciA